MAEQAPRPGRALLIKLALAGVMLLVATILVARGLDLRGLLAQGLQLVREAGPVAFFTGMALLPAAGAPMSAFTLTVGSAFAGSLGMGWVIVLSLLAITVNLGLTYFLARWAIRPVVRALFSRLGYKLPQAGAANARDLIILLRVTPGVPFPIQNYLLGLADVPPGKYLLVSCLVTWPLSLAFILFGEALLQGRGKTALISFSLIIALMAATQLVRQHYGRKSSAPAADDETR